MQILISTLVVLNLIVLVILSYIVFIINNQTKFNNICIEYISETIDSTKKVLQNIHNGIEGNTKSISNIIERNNKQDNTSSLLTRVIKDYILGDIVITKQIVNELEESNSLLQKMYNAKKSSKNTKDNKEVPNDSKS